MDINSFFQTTIDRNASDLHIIPEHFPTIRVNNEIYPLRNFEQMTKETSEKLILSILTEEQKENLFSNKEIDFGYEYNQYRFRINIYHTKNQLAAAFRLIPSRIKTIDELNLPQIFHRLSKYKQGLILISGPTGEGKSTTLASIINEINHLSAKHIITIEDPIEFVYPKEMSIISQRELHQDTHSWTISLRSALREDPDVVLIGEMRDFDTIQAALTIAETGHLVFSTLHTGTTSEALDRIVDVFPSQQQNQIRSQMASVLIAIVAQRLVPTVDQKSRLPACEILINSPSVSAIIRDGKNFMLDNVMETSEDQGMILFEKYLVKLFQAGKITNDTALTYALRPNEIKKFLV